MLNVKVRQLEGLYLPLAAFSREARSQIVPMVQFVNACKSSDRNILAAKPAKVLTEEFIAMLVHEHIIGRPAEVKSMPQLMAAGHSLDGYVSTEAYIRKVFVPDLLDPSNRFRGFLKTAINLSSFEKIVDKLTIELPKVISYVPKVVIHANRVNFTQTKFLALASVLLPARPNIRPLTEQSGPILQCVQYHLLSSFQLSQRKTDEVTT